MINRLFVKSFFFFLSLQILLVLFISANVHQFEYFAYTTVTLIDKLFAMKIIHINNNAVLLMHGKKKF